jgi:shikimate kinase
MLYFLVGFMGSGKSHWAKIWAAKNHLGYLDLDHVIEAEENKTIADIFEKNGEDYFRKVEAKKLRECEAFQNTIVSCGGGAPCFFDNMKWMNEHGKTIYLKANPEEIMRRLENGQEERPLIKKFNRGELLFFIDQKLKERENFYQMATLQFASTDLTDDTFIQKIVTA